jgi:hypothetical protein
MDYSAGLLGLDTKLLRLGDSDTRQGAKPNQPYKR